MTTTIKTVTASTISRMLHTIFARSERLSTRIAGCYQNSTGFRVSTDARGTVWVEHHGKNALNQVNAYDTYLRSKGFYTIRRTDHSITVHAENMD